MSTATAPDIADRALAWLIAEQDTQGLSGREMAARIGMREQEWSRIRRGHRTLSAVYRERACQAFPELREIVFGKAS